MPLRPQNRLLCNISRARSAYLMVLGLHQLCLTQDVIYFKTMSHEGRIPKNGQRTKAGKVKRKASLPINGGPVEFEYTVEQAQVIQSKLPPGLWLVDVSGQNFEKAKLEIYQQLGRSVDGQRLKFETIVEPVSQKSLFEAPKKKNMGHGKKNYGQERYESIQPQQSKQEKTPREPSHKKKLSKYNNGDKSEIQLPLPPNEKIKEKQKQPPKATLHMMEQMQAEAKVNQSAEEMVSQNIIPLNQEILKEVVYEVGPGIPALVSGLPRYVEYTEKELDDTAQANSLRVLFGLKHHALADHSRTLNEKQKIFCMNICQRLRSHRSSQPFRVAVDPQSQRVPDYFYVIYNPMDLQTIFRKIIKEKYHYISQFHADINQIILNSYKYNLRETVYFNATVEFEDYYQALLVEARQNPEEFIKESLYKFGRKKMPGQRDFIEKTPMKEKKRLRGSKTGSKKLFKAKHQRKRKEEDDQDYDVQMEEEQEIAESELLQPEMSPIIEDSSIVQQSKHHQRKNKEKNLTKSKSIQKPRDKIAVLEKLNLNRANSMPLQHQDLEIFEQSLEFHNTQSYNTSLVQPKQKRRTRKPFQQKTHTRQIRIQAIKNAQIQLQVQNQRIQPQNPKQPQQQQQVVQQNYQGQNKQSYQMPMAVENKYQNQQYLQRQGPMGKLNGDYNDDYNDDDMLDAYLFDQNDNDYEQQQEQEKEMRVQETVKQEKNQQIADITMQNKILPNSQEKIQQKSNKFFSFSQQVQRARHQNNKQTSITPPLLQKNPKKTRTHNATPTIQSEKQITMYISSIKNSQNPKIMQQQKKSSQKFYTKIHSHGQQHSITVNNLNTHPQAHLELVQISKEHKNQIQKKTNDQIFVQLGDHINPSSSKATAAVEKAEKVSKGAAHRAKYGKNKRKNGNQNKESSEEEFVLHTSRYTKKNSKKIVKKDDQKQSFSGGSPRPKRGRRSNKQLLNLRMAQHQKQQLQVQVQVQDSQKNQQNPQQDHKLGNFEPNIVPAMPKNDKYHDYYGQIFIEPEVEMDRKNELHLNFHQF